VCVCARENEGSARVLKAYQIYRGVLASVVCAGLRELTAGHHIDIMHIIGWSGWAYSYSGLVRGTTSTVLPRQSRSKGRRKCLSTPLTPHGHGDL
jgi:hypothetical protein